MALSYIIQLQGQTYDENSSGYNFQEVRLYDVSGIDLSSTNALEAVMVELPILRSLHSTVSGLWLSNRKVMSLSDTEDLIQATLTYKTPTPFWPSGASTQDYETWEWNVMAQQGNISAAEVGKVKAWDYYRVQEGAGTGNEWINQTIDNTLIRENRETGEVAGADVYLNAGSVQVTKYYADKEDVGKTFRKQIYALQAKTNDASWIDWSEGEVLYLGATIAYGVDDCTVRHQFLFGDTKTSPQFKIAPSSGLSQTLQTVTPSSIRPFDYVWQTPMSRNAAFSGSVPQIAEVIARDLRVARVYDEGDFSVLGLIGPAAGGS